MSGDAVKKILKLLSDFIHSDRFAEVFRFGVAGVAGFIIDYGLLFLLTEFLGLNYLLSSGISFTASVLVNYIICVLWVFESVNQRDVKSVVLFAGSSIVGLGINQALMWFFVEVIGFYYMIAKIFATLLVMIWNYIMKRKAVVG